MRLNSMVVMDVFILYKIWIIIGSVNSKSKL